MNPRDQSFIYHNFAYPLDEIELFLEMNSWSFYNTKVLIVLRLTQYPNLFYWIITIYFTTNYCLFFFADFKNIFNVYGEQYYKYYKWMGSRIFSIN